MTSSRLDLRNSPLWIAPDLAGTHDLAVVAALLDRAAGIEPGTHELTVNQCESLDDHRLLSLVPRDWDAPEGVSLRMQQHALTAQQLAHTADAERVIAALTNANIEHRLLKGAASCFLDYADPSLRTFGDVDLLVHQQDFDRTRALLHKTLRATTPDPGRDGYRFDIEATMTLPSGTEIDVHHRLSPFCLDVVALFADGEPVHELKTTALSNEFRLCHAALHVISTPPGKRRLSGLADVAAIRASHDLDLATVRDRASQLGVEALVGLALAIERTARGLPVDTAHWHELTFLERHSFARAERQTVLEQIHRVRQIEGAGSRARFVISRLLPTRSQVEKRGGLGDYFGRLLPDRFQR